MLAVWSMDVDRGQSVGNCASSIMKFRKGRAGASARGLTQAYLQAVPQRERVRERGRGRMAEGEIVVKTLAFHRKRIEYRCRFKDIHETFKLRQC